MGVDYNATFNMGEAKVNLSLEYYDQNATNRAGITQDGPGTAPSITDTNEAGANIYTGVNDPLYIRDLSYFNNVSDWMTENPDTGMKVGQPKLTKKSALVNITLPLGDNSELYTFHTFTSRYGQSYAYYRSPFWRGDVQAAEFISSYEDFVGYHPTFETEVLDNMNVLGLKFNVGDWKTDLSATYGRNYVSIVN